MRVALLAAALLLGGCYAERDERDVMINHGDGRITLLDRSPTYSVGAGVNPREAARKAAARNEGGGVIDLAKVLSTEQEQVIGQRLSELEQGSGRQVMVVLLSPQKGQSLEQVGWAVSKGAGAAPLVMVLVNPENRQIRLEGDLRPEAKAKVAAAMQPGLAAGQVAVAIERGLARLEQLAP